MFASAVYSPTMAGENSNLGNGCSLNNNEDAFEGTSSDFDDSLIVNGVRNRKRNVELPCCPICSCTLRPHELQSHLALEMEKLCKLSVAAPKRKSSGPIMPGPSSNGSLPEEDVPMEGSEVYERVKRNRERRLRAGRGGARVACPVCGKQLAAAAAEVHVEACLRRGRDSDDESIDVEGDAEQAETGFGATYEWCSQVRVRSAALHMREGGDAPHGALRVRRASTDTHLVVDGDEDVMLYGPSQYSPGRIALEEDTEAESGWGTTTGNDPIPEEDPVHPIFSPENNSGQRPITPDRAACYDVVVEALKARIRELEQRLGARDHRAETKCLICMGPYAEPVVSVQCWHVHCENCWLDSLRAKKTCPQCNAITTAQNLRRIYI